MLTPIPMFLAFLVTMASAIPDAAIARPGENFQFISFGGPKAAVNIVSLPNFVSVPSFAPRTIPSAIPVVARAPVAPAVPKPAAASPPATKDYGLASKYPKTDPASSSYGK